MLNKTNRRRATTLATLALVTMTGIAWAQQQGPVGKVGQALDGAGKTIKRGVLGAEAAVSDGFARTRSGVHNMEVVSRIYSRLHWEKALTTSNLEIVMKADGVAVLTGIVPNATAKDKAVSLTADTVGVVQVIDQMAIALPTRVIPGTTKTETLPK